MRQAALKRLASLPLSASDPSSNFPLLSTINAGTCCQHQTTMLIQMLMFTFGLVDAVPLHERIRHAAQGVHHVLVGKVALAHLAGPLRAEVGALPGPDERLLMSCRCQDQEGGGEVLVIRFNSMVQCSTVLRSSASW